MIRYLTLALLAALCLAQPIAYGAGNSNGKWPTFSRSGTISEVDSGTHAIVVGNNRLYLSLRVVVHGLSHTGSFSMLRPGQLIGWAPVGRNRNSSTVREIWILPPS